MVWQQVYDPLNSAVLSTILAAIPIVVLLGTLAFLRMAAHWAAILGLVSALLIAILVFGMPASMALGLGRTGRDVRTAAHRVDRPEHHLSVPADQGQGLLPGPPGQHRQCHRGPPAAAAADRVRVRRLLRGRGGVRHTRGGDRRDPDRAGLLASGGVRAVADREYGAGRLRRAGHADHHARQGHRPGRDGAVGHGRTAAAVLFGARAVLADLGVLRLEGSQGNLASHPGHRRDLRHPAVPDFQLPWPDAGGRGRGADIHGLPDLVPEGLEAQGDLAHHEAQRARDRQRRGRSAQPLRASPDRPGGPGLDSLADPDACSCSPGASRPSRIC